MKLTHKLSLTFGVFIIVSFGTILYILTSITSRNFEIVEEEIYQKAMRSAYEIIKSDFEQFNSFLFDYAEWSETEKFVKGENKDFIEINLSYHIYEDNGIDFVAIYDEDEEFMYGKEYSPHTNLLVPIYDPLKQIFEHYNLKIIPVNLTRLHIHALKNVYRYPSWKCF